MNFKEIPAFYSVLCHFCLISTSVRGCSWSKYTTHFQTRLRVWFLDILFYGVWFPDSNVKTKHKQQYILLPFKYQTGPVFRSPLYLEITWLSKLSSCLLYTLTSVWMLCTPKTGQNVRHLFLVNPILKKIINALH